MQRVLFTAAMVFGTALQPTLVRGDVLSTTGAIHLITPPASVAPGALKSNEFIQLFVERQRVTLASPVAVDFTAPGFYNGTSDLPPVPPVIAAGTHVDSYFLHADNIGTLITLYDGSVTFTTDILGVIIGNPVANPRLDITDPSLGYIGTTYPSPGNHDRDLELGPGTTADHVTLSNDRRTLTLHLAVLPNVDQVRVLTAETPSTGVAEPSSCALILAGILGLAVWRRGKRRGLFNTLGS